MTKDEALHYAAAVFKSYALHHDNKGDHEKATRNDAHAQMMLDALAEPTVRESLIVAPTVSNSLTVQTKEALRLAEEALGSWKGEGMYINCHWTKEDEKALAALRAALVDAVDTSEKCVDETPECGHEPVAWKRESDGALFGFEVYEGLTPLYAAPVDPVALLKSSKANFERQFGKQVFADWVYYDLTYSFENYTTQPVKQEPVAWKAGNVIELKKPQFENGWQPLYTTPQPRQDVDLTDDEAAEAAHKGFNDYWTEDCKGLHTEAWASSGRAVLAKYKEKNSGN